MARASTRTLLSLDQFAEIVGINPLHFNGGVINSTNPIVMPLNNQCGDLYFQHAWQANDRVSREELAREIYNAEYAIARYLGYWPAPKWTVAEEHPYPIGFAREYVFKSRDLRGDLKSVNTKWGHIISGGRRGADAIEAGVSVSYSDPDSDGYNELATVSVTTTVTDKQQVRLFFAGHSGDERWEIRPLKNVVISGGTATITVDSWKLIDPDLWEALPTDAGQSGILAGNASNLVTTVDVYRVYNDTSLAASQFIWDTDCNVCSGTGCEVCNGVTQDGCLFVKDSFGGLINPYPATYSGGSWTRSDWTYSHEPRKIKLWYYAGSRSEWYISGDDLEPMPQELARAVTFLTVARLDRNLCTCNSVADFVSRMQADTAGTERGRSTFFSDEIVNSPFGTKRGEVEAFRMLKRLQPKRAKFAVI